MACTMICCAQMLCARAGLLRLPSHLRWQTSCCRARARFHTNCAAASSDRLPPPDVHKLAKFAQIAVTDEEVRAFAAHICQRFWSCLCRGVVACCMTDDAALYIRQAAVWGSQIGEIVRW